MQCLSPVPSSAVVTNTKYLYLLLQHLYWPLDRESHLKGESGIAMLLAHHQQCSTSIPVSMMAQSTAAPIRCISQRGAAQTQGLRLASVQRIGSSPLHIHPARCFPEGPTFAQRTFAVFYIPLTGHKGLSALRLTTCDIDRSTLRVEDPSRENPILFCMNRAAQV